MIVVALSAVAIIGAALSLPIYVIHAIKTATVLAKNGKYVKEKNPGWFCTTIFVYAIATVFLWTLILAMGRLAIYGP
jgi:hypothetical protein